MIRSFHMTGMLLAGYTCQSCEGKLHHPSNKGAVTMNYLELQEAVEDARRTNARFESQIKSLSELLCGHLRAVNKDHMWQSTNTLRKLKKELTEFNAITGQWKS